MSTLIPGKPCTFDDPLGYGGTGTIVEVQERPTHAVLVKIASITDRTDQGVVGREVWILAPHVQPVEPTAYELLERAADAAYEKEDQGWFYDQSTEDLVALWAQACDINRGAAWDDEVYEALAERGHFGVGT